MESAQDNQEKKEAPAGEEANKMQNGEKPAKQEEKQRTQTKITDHFKSAKP